VAGPKVQGKSPADFEMKVCVVLSIGRANESDRFASAQDSAHFDVDAFQVSVKVRKKSPLSLRC